MEGYLGDPEATAAVLRDGWLDTGDLGFLHDGELYLTGRAKDVVILRGRNYAPEEIEQAVDGVPGVRTGCAVAASWLPEEARGEELALFVETARSATAPKLEAPARRLPRGGARRHRSRSPTGWWRSLPAPAAHLLRQAPPRRDAAPLPRRRAGAAGAR